MTITTAQVALAAPIVAVAGTLLGGWVQARRDDRRWQREREHERERWDREQEARREEWSREDARAWSEERRTVYAGFMSAAQDAFTELISVKSKVGKPEKSPDVVGPMTATMVRLHKSSAALDLVAADSTREAAEQLWQKLASGCLAAILLNGDPDSENQWENLNSALDSYGQLSASLVAAAKADLGTAGH